MLTLLPSAVHAWTNGAQVHRSPAHQILALRGGTEMACINGDEPGPNRIAHCKDGRTATEKRLAPKALRGGSSTQQLALTVADTTLAAVGVGVGLWLLSYLEALVGQPLYASSLSSSAVLMFWGHRPPPLRNVFVGTLGGTLIAVAAVQLLGDSDLARSACIGAVMLYFKSTNSLFPPAAALSATFFDNDQLQKVGWLYPLFPCAVGTAVLYALALAVCRVRLEARLWAGRAVDGTLEEAVVGSAASKKGA